LESFGINSGLQKFILTVMDKSKEVIDLYREMAVKRFQREDP